MDVLPCDSFAHAFEAVEDGRAQLAVIPIENSHAGRVAEIHNLLPHSDLHIIGEYFHHVRHHLLGIPGAKLDGIKEVYSHPQALMQCAGNMRELGLQARPYSDTAAAAEHIAHLGDMSKAALASRLAGERYGLEVAKENMHDADDNTTLFIVLSKEPEEIAASDEKMLCSMLFTTRNISAGLYKALGGFATNGVNIMKLESYIPEYKSGTAQFFITFEGSPRDRHVQHALDELGFFTSDAKLLGVYPSSPQRYR